MKIKISLALLVLAASAAAQAQVPISAQTAPPPAGAGSVQEYSFPSQPGSYSPPSTLRMTVSPEAAPAQQPPVRDTPESLRKYTECRDEADRASTSSAKMREAVGQCLQDLNARRARGE
ncbi:hypothetical protein [Achromobacter aloeverae]|uniref:Uncharacterized protein n=1 Tax=Achromobacter aloeverae TaxID=1750518 RepID=A0A4V1MRC2_9BURK|nr:hypothetical protein [Achromobacter aloeverae]RXN83226.1 hypothetical protein C7R54_27415 [Achromobacter aloeverae]